MKVVFEISRETAWWYLSLRCLKNAVFETRCFDCTTQIYWFKLLFFLVLGSDINIGLNQVLYICDLLEKKTCLDQASEINEIRTYIFDFEQMMKHPNG